MAWITRRTSTHARQHSASWRNVGSLNSLRRKSEKVIAGVFQSSTTVFYIDKAPRNHTLSTVGMKT